MTTIKTQKITYTPTLRKARIGSKLNLPYFQITVDTTKAGSASDTFVLPTFGIGYDALVQWGDGTEQQISGTPGNVSHTYPTAGTYQIRISGLFPRIRFNGTGDYRKLMSVDNWGDIQWLFWGEAFTTCTNMTIKAKDHPYCSLSIGYTGAFKWMTQLVSLRLKSFVQSKANNTVELFYGCVNLETVDISNWDTSGVILFSQMFYNCAKIKINLSGLSIKSATNLNNMLLGCNINVTGTTTNYDETLISFASQAQQYSKTGLSFHGGTSKYSAAGKTARDLLTLPVLDGGFGWTITDGGLLT